MTIKELTYIDPFRAITRLYSLCLFGLLLINIIHIQYICLPLSVSSCRLQDTVKSSPLESIGKISVYKHCFFYSNVPTTGTKGPLFRQPMRLCLAH